MRATQQFRWYFPCFQKYVGYTLMQLSKTVMVLQLNQCNYRQMGGGGERGCQALMPNCPQILSVCMRDHDALSEMVLSRLPPLPYKHNLCSHRNKISQCSFCVLIPTQCIHLVPNASTSSDVLFQICSAMFCGHNNKKNVSKPIENDTQEQVQMPLKQQQDLVHTDALFDERCIQ